MLARGVNPNERNRDLSAPNHGLGFWWFQDQFAKNRIARVNGTIAPDAEWQQRAESPAIGAANWWWLRCPGDYGGVAAGIDDDRVQVVGFGVDRGGGGVG